MKHESSSIIVDDSGSCSKFDNHEIMDRAEKGIYVRKKIILQSTITCPNCGHQKEESMPMDACQYFYGCENCKSTLKPKKGHCCVFCSYGTVPCPSIQNQRKCC